MDLGISIRRMALFFLLNPSLTSCGKKESPDFPVIITSYEVAVQDSDELNKIGEFTHAVFQSSVLRSVLTL